MSSCNLCGKTRGFGHICEAVSRTREAMLSIELCQRCGYYHRLGDHGGPEVVWSYALNDWPIRSVRGEEPVRLVPRNAGGQNVTDRRNGVTESPESVTRNAGTVTERNAKTAAERQAAYRARQRVGA